MNMQIIPAIDIIDGKCVRLKEGDYDQLTAYETSPLEMAKQYEAHGITRLHLVDLDGAKKGEVCNWKVAEQYCCMYGMRSMEVDSSQPPTITFLFLVSAPNRKVSAPNSSIHS